jgi:hypothetical protein
MTMLISIFHFDVDSLHVIIRVLAAVTAVLKLAKYSRRLKH